MSMTASRPYLVRALYEWILDNSCAPYILVNALADGVLVPQEHVKDGQIILNISPAAVNALRISNDGIEFHGRFAGIPNRVSVPMMAVLGIYAKENGQGMFFENDSPPRPGPRPAPNTGASDSKPGRPRGGRPPLRVVK